MKVVIRTDSSLLIGTGHVSRCLTLAHYLKERGISIVFACRDLDGNIISIIEEKQFKVIKLSSPEAPVSGDQYDQMRAVSIALEMTEMETLCQQEKPDWLVVDHYGLNEDWERSIKNQGIRLFVIDDQLRKHTCNALLDQNYHLVPTPYQSLVPPDTKCFTGPEFALLNARFNEITPRVRNFHKISKILVFFGGTDPEGVTVRFLRSVIGLESFHFEVVAGIKNPYLKEIEAICLGKSHITLHVQVNNMAQLIDESDLYFGSGGTITWERCSLGLPGICVSVAENQTEISKALGISQIHWFLGESKNLSSEDYKNALIKVAQEPELLKLFHNESLKLKVGKSIEKVLEVFLD